MNPAFVNNIFETTVSFTDKANGIFQYQYESNHIYKLWCNAMKAKPHKKTSLNEIPFLPISFFKTHKVISGSFEPKVVFESSGTAKNLQSCHYVKDVEIYKTSFTKGFNIFYGDVSEWCIAALLPSYLERDNSSLVLMAQTFINQSNNNKSGFFLYNYEALKDLIKYQEQQQQKTLLLGVTFAVLDFAEQFSMPLKYTTVMETGGMKGRKIEITRQEVHDILKNTFSVSNVHSEYGMTELLSQAYAKSNGKFFCPPWMKVFTRDDHDPLHVKSSGSGALNIIDLANVHSCSFIATDDLGIVYEDGSFEVLGRLDSSDIRGCSLMAL